jgi:SAM-dependent methyltransferase
VLGHSEQELERLIAQAQLYERFTVDFFSDAGIGEGMRVLDVGCGAGDASFLAAGMVGPTGEVIGVDRSPVAVATATSRARDLGVANAHFLVGDAADLAMDEPFDGALGRFVLSFLPDPSATLRSIMRRVRPGGIIAFQEGDWSGCRAVPDVPTYSRCVDWGIETFKRTGVDPYMGLNLAGAFISAGLPTPTLSIRAGIGSGPQHPIYTSIAELIGALQPAMEAHGVATAAEVDAETLASRISAQAVAASATVVWFSIVGAIAHAS